MTPPALDLEAARRASQLAFVASGQDLEIGALTACPVGLDVLLALGRGHPDVREVHESGLTAIVYKLHAQGRDWAVKRARPACLVQNVDGQTSFLNELQRRAELAALQAPPNATSRWAGLAPTIYGSLRHGVIVSPWIDGQRVTDWSERRLRQVFSLGRELLRAGFFEWDFSPGNLLDDGEQVWLFDFGYMYRFDPLRHFNSSGNGRSVPQCHLAERIETRHAFSWLLQVEQSQGLDAALQAFARVKTVALQTFGQLRDELQADGAQAGVLDWLDSIMKGWREALAGDAELHALYLHEGWRSHVLDLEDDLHGQTCTPSTLKRADWLLSALRETQPALAARGVFFGDDVGVGAGELIARYEDKRRLAVRYQTASASPA